MKRRYVLNDRYPIPAVLVWLMASGGISLVLITVLGLCVSIFWTGPDRNLLDAFPGFITVLFGIWGGYTGICAILIWIAM